MPKAAKYRSLTAETHTFGISREDSPVIAPLEDAIDGA